MVDNTKILPATQETNEYITLGWSHHTKGEQEAAVENFQKAIAKDSKSIEGLYGLALVLKSQGRRRDSKMIFEQIISIIDEEMSRNSVRKTMLKRLVKAHINQIQEGDWNLEKEIWQK